MDAEERILLASLELFMQYGFKTVTVDEIARRSGISKKTLYQHFETKDDIVERAMRSSHKKQADEIDAITARSKNAVEAMVRINQSLDAMYRQINPLALLELQRFFPTSYKAFRDEMLKRDAGSLERNLRWGMDEGYYRENLHAPLLALYRMESCLIVFQPGAMINTRFQPHVVNKETTELFLYGIMTAKGERLYTKYKDTYNTQEQK